MYESERLRLRRVDPERDLADRVRWMTDPETTRYLAMRPALLSRESVRSFLEESASSADQGAEFAVETKDGRHIGGTSIRSFSHVARSAEYAGMIGEAEFRGKGYGTEMVRLMVDVAFRNFNLNRFWLNVYEPNIGAVRAYEKAGFVKEGLLREYVYLHGEYLNAYIMSVLKSDWTDWERERTVEPK